MLRAAVRYVRDPSAAEDVVQTTWMGFLNSLDRFEGRCSIKTWLFRILFNKAQTRAARDRRLVPFSTLVANETREPFTAVDPSRFLGPDDDGPTGHWAASPPAWKTDPEQLLADKEAERIVRRAIHELPLAQGYVMMLRDIEGFSAKEVCNALCITKTNQRVLLHRARAKVRRRLSEVYGSGI